MSQDIARKEARCQCPVGWQVAGMTRDTAPCARSHGHFEGQGTLKRAAPRQRSQAQASALGAWFFSLDPGPHCDLTRQWMLLLHRCCCNATTVTCTSSAGTRSSLADSATMACSGMSLGHSISSCQ